MIISSVFQKYHYDSFHELLEVFCVVGKALNIKYLLIYQHVYVVSLLYFEFQTVFLNFRIHQHTCKLQQVITRGTSFKRY